jgi:hypothetical protein
VPEDFFDELTFVWRSALDTEGEGKTVIIDNNHDLGALPASRRPDREAPFFAPVEGGVDESLLRFQYARACSSPASIRRILSSFPSRTHC